MAQRALTNLGLNTGWVLGEDGWKAGMERNLLLLDTLVQGRVQGVIDVPPSDPTSGDAYIVGGGASGVWSTRANQIAVYDNDAWHFITPLSGWRMYVISLGIHYQFNDTGWRPDVSHTDYPIDYDDSGVELRGQLRIHRDGKRRDAQFLGTAVDASDIDTGVVLSADDRPPHWVSMVGGQAVGGNGGPCIIKITPDGEVLTDVMLNADVTLSGWWYVG